MKLAFQDETIVEFLIYYFIESKLTLYSID